MARRKKSKETGYGKSGKPNRKNGRPLPKEKGKKAKELSRIRTAICSLLILAVLLIVNNWKSANNTAIGEELEVHYVDVGQGDCIYITCGGENMLIDCGEANKAPVVRSYLDELEVDSLDYVIGTHPHSDHMGGMADIVENYDIGEFYVPVVSDEDMTTAMYFRRFLNAAEKKELALIGAECGKIVKLGGAEWEIIAPVNDNYGNANNYSIGIILRYGENSFIFTGDAEAKAEKEMVNSGRIEDIDVYKAGHHGSDTSSSDIFLDAIRPEIAVISCGSGNKYGHPDEAAMERISRYADDIYRTDLNGTIVITSDGENLDVRTERSDR